MFKFNSTIRPQWYYSGVCTINWEHISPFLDFRLSQKQLRIFLNFYMKLEGLLEGLKGQKLTMPKFSEKCSFWEKAQIFLQNRGLSAFAENLFCWCVFFYPKNGAKILQKNHVWEKSGSLVMA